MKSLILITALFTGAAHAQSDNYCLVMGGMANTIAEARKQGVQEAKLLAMAPPTTTRETNDTFKMLTQYVFTMQLSPADARRLVYLKCLAGDFGRY